MFAGILAKAGGLLGKVGLQVLGWAAIAGVGLAVLVGVRNAGRTKAYLEAAEEKLKQGETRREVEETLGALPPGDPERERLRQRFTRRGGPMMPLLLLVVLTAVAGCGDRLPVVAGGCDWTRTIWLQPSDKLADDTLDQVLAHNLTRERICGPEKVAKP